MLIVMDDHVGQHNPQISPCRAQRLVQDECVLQW